MTAPLTILLTAAHSGYSENVPLGGGATISSQLIDEWNKTHPFRLEVLGPALLGSHAPRGTDLVAFSERQYARFCQDFEKAVTDRILAMDPGQCVVLSNDVSEGPNFKLLADRGYRIFTIYHVNVVDYFTAIYLHHGVKTATAARVYAALERSPIGPHLPAILRLAFGKQRDSLIYSKGVIVPSQGMKEVLLKSYPEANPEKIHVLPWGLPAREADSAASETGAQDLRRRYGLPPDAAVLLTLSRLSPEKGQDRLLEALRVWEQELSYPSQGVWVFVCGEAAFMQGKGFERKLRRLAGRLKKTRVIFPGHVTGAQKQAFFKLADLYVFPSRHESYGLTLLEALAAGLPALACAHYGAEDILKPEFGELIPQIEERLLPRRLADALQRLLSDRQRLKRMGAQAAQFGATQKFSGAAAKLAELLHSSPI